MSEIFINKAKTCAFSGHRILPEDFDKEGLKKLLTNTVDKGFDTFLIGMALGFDTLCFQILEEIRREKKINLIACVPCENQSKNFSEKDKKEYARMIESADQVVYISKQYTSGCMHQRNRFMVDNCCFLICYLRKNYGGTYFTKNYAQKKGISILNF